jgi:transcriptional regulator GlxA family with amidase domain
LSKSRSPLEGVPDRKSVTSVATSIGMSEYHFIRLFASVFGETPGQYAVRSRLAKAKTLLASTDATISKITVALGYQSAGSFSNLFKDRFGLTPSQYRSVAIARESTTRVPAELLDGCVSLMCGIEHSNIQ